MASSIRYEFEFSKAIAPVARIFGVHDGNSEVVIDEVAFSARFGPWSVTTGLDNIAAAEVSGPYSPWKVAGPAHLSLSDGGLTFGSNATAGTCITFHTPVTGIDPLGLIRHRGLTVTVRDPLGLAEALSAIAAIRRDEAGLRIEPTELIEQMHDDLRSLTAAQLRRRAEELGLEHTSRSSKAELVDVLETAARTAVNET
jgi:hypothetical protein